MLYIAVVDTLPSVQLWVLVCFISILTSCDLSSPPKHQNDVLLSKNMPP